MLHCMALSKQATVVSSSDISTIPLGEICYSIASCTPTCGCVCACVYASMAVLTIVVELGFNQNRSLRYISNV